MDTRSDRQLAVDLYVRADATSSERRDDVIERLKQLDQRDEISTFRVYAWPRAISLELVDELHESPITDVVRTFEAWADQQESHIRPAFQAQTSHSTLFGKSDERLVLPVMCLAAYSDGDLRWIVPFRDEETVLTVEDALESLAPGVATTLESKIDDGFVPVDPSLEGTIALESTNATSVSRNET